LIAISLESLFSEVTTLDEVLAAGLSLALLLTNSIRNVSSGSCGIGQSRIADEAETKPETRALICISEKENENSTLPSPAVV
jgi:hypothetical protein